MKKQYHKKAFLEHLRKIPIIQVSCEKAGIARATIYRWKKESKKFAKEMEQALVEGEALINDMSESQLISLIRDKNWPAISFWLKHRNPKFRERVEITTKIEKRDELSPEQKNVVREALKLASLGKPKKLTTDNKSNEKTKNEKEEK